MKNREENPYWRKDWTDYALPVCFGILAVLGAVTLVLGAVTVLMR